MKSAVFKSKLSAMIVACSIVDLNKKLTLCHPRALSSEALAKEEGEGSSFLFCWIHLPAFAGMTKKRGCTKIIRKWV